MGISNMKIHNIMEDIVIRYVDEILAEKKEFCPDEQCRMDIICYSLNKIRPMYVVSSRGIIHTHRESSENVQRDIDVFAIVAEAVDLVSKTRRDEDRNITLDKDRDSEYDYQFCYNFPVIMGRVLDSDTQLPTSSCTVSLYLLGEHNPIGMFNRRWKNPQQVVGQMEGTFNFWPEPLIADKAGIQKDFQFYIKIEKDNYSPIKKFFELRLVSTDKILKTYLTENLYQLEDTFLHLEEL